MRQKSCGCLKSVRLFLHATLRICDVACKPTRTLWLPQCVTCMRVENNLGNGNAGESRILTHHIHRLWTVYEMAPLGVRGGIQVLDTGSSPMAGLCSRPMSLSASTSWSTSSVCAQSHALERQPDAPRRIWVLSSSFKMCQVSLASRFHDTSHQNAMNYDADIRKVCASCRG